MTGWSLPILTTASSLSPMKSGPEQKVGTFDEEETSAFRFFYSSAMDCDIDNRKASFSDLEITPGFKKGCRAGAKSGRDIHKRAVVGGGRKIEETSPDRDTRAT
jgi:hypothetical protein